MYLSYSLQNGSDWFPPSLRMQKSFFTLAPNDRGYGHLAVCGSIRCRETTKWMREQNLLNARQPANEHRRVLWPVVWFFHLFCCQLCKSWKSVRFAFQSVRNKVVWTQKGSSVTKSSQVLSFFSWLSNCVNESISWLYILFFLLSLSECAKTVELPQSQS